VSERWLRSMTGAMYWFAMAIIAAVCTLIPTFADEPTWAAVLIGASLLLSAVDFWLLPHARPDRFQFWTELNILPALLFNAVLLQLSRSTELVLMNMLVALIYAAFFFRIPALIVSVAAALGVAVSALLIDPAAQAPFLDSFMAIYLPTLLLLPVLIHMQNRETLDALDQARFRALSDPLTGLANLRAIEDAVEAELARDESGRGGVLGLVLIDLDNFKSANSKYGHAGGDYALREVAKQLMRIAPKNALVARVGGDGFAVLLRGRSREHVTTTGELIRSAPRAASAVMDLPGVAIDAALGIAICPEDGRDLNELLDFADRSMYQDKGDKRHPMPNLEAAQMVDPTKRPTWLNVTAATPDKDEHRLAALDRLLGGQVGWLASRTLYARVSALAWLIGSSVLAISLSMPAIQAESKLPWWLVLGVGIGVACGALLMNVKAERLTHTATDILVLAALAAGIALTGGFASPVGLLLILLVASQSWFWQTQHLAMRVIGPALVALSPIAYQSVEQAPQGTVSVATACGLALLLVTLVLSMQYDRLLLRSLEQRAERSGLIDPLTEIPNRRAFDTEVQELIEAEPQKPFAIVILDLDNFRRVNIEHGHRAGDQVLRAVAQSLQSVTRSADLITRIGGDEFALVLPGVQVDAARSLAERCIATVATTPEAQRHGVGASAGFALFPLHGATLDELVFTADSALLAVKASGKGSARVARIVSAVN
jgi:diguanylate cyclase (GGDEF)-like protein